MRKRVRPQLVIREQDMDKVREAVDKTIAEGHGVNMDDFNRNLKADTAAFEQFVNRLKREPK